MTKYTGPTKDDRVFFPVVKNSVIFCVLGGTSVISHFFCWGGPVPYLELFWVGQFEKATLYIEHWQAEVKGKNVSFNSLLGTTRMRT